MSDYVCETCWEEARFVFVSLDTVLATACDEHRLAEVQRIANLVWQVPHPMGSWADFAELDVESWVNISAVRNWGGTHVWGTRFNRRTGEAEPPNDDWWLRLVYEDTTPVPELATNHMSKLHIAVARHLAMDHAHRFDRQVGLSGITALHNKLHGTTTGNPWTSVLHPHEALGGSTEAVRDPAQGDVE